MASWVFLVTFASHGKSEKCGDSGGSGCGHEGGSSASSTVPEPVWKTLSANLQTFPQRNDCARQAGLMPVQCYALWLPSATCPVNALGPLDAHGREVVLSTGKIGSWSLAVL